MEVKHYFSSCCMAGTHKDSSDDGTFTYVCDKCGKDCDVVAKIADRDKIFLVKVNESKKYSFTELWNLIINSEELSPQEVELLKERLTDDIIEEGSIQQNLLKKLESIK